MHRFLQFLTICLVLTGCIGVAKSPVYINSQAKQEYENSVRIMVSCDDGEQYVGTGFILNETQIITAKHLSSCDPFLYRVYVRELTGITEYAAVADKKSPEVDAMRLKILDPVEFKNSVDIRSNLPLVGEELCSVGGGSLQFSWAKKCGFVTYADKEVIIVSIPVIPGNSGSPLYDKYGRVVGVITRGVFNPYDEKLGVAVPVTAWKDLLKE